MGMILKKYQKEVMNDLSSYMNCLAKCENLTSAWREYWFRKDINVGVGGVPPYNNAIPGVPHICMKVPTGGGKTFMACTAIKKIFDTMPLDKPKVVVWLVPSDSILTQTIDNLSNVNHPYRQQLDMDFSGKVGIYTKEQLLNGQNFSPDTVREMLTVCILSYSSLRIDSRLKDVRKVYQENGNLLKFADYFNDKEVLLADTPDTALIQVLRQLSPVAVVDESHNATSDLSVEMLTNVNPSFILDLTATPRTNSNIISYVDARELKRENMVKLPVVVYNRDSRTRVIQDAIHLRANIESQAIEERKNDGDYIRPIVLFQAQPNIKGKENETFDSIKEKLLEIGIPEEEIGIKTSTLDTISGIDLLSENCQIRYIITVNALKEGWDCPFAYILASLANKNSAVDVEQIVGRILRQPYAKRHSLPLLNTSYVLSCSNEFRTTLDSIVAGLNKSGFSKKDYRVGGDTFTKDTKYVEGDNSFGKQTTVVDTITDYEYEDLGEDNNVDTLSDVSVDIITSNFGGGKQLAENEEINEMMSQAEKQSQEYNQEVEESFNNGFIGGDLGDMLTQNKIQEQYKESVEEIKIPQFVYEGIPNFFGEEYELLEKDNLSEGFSLEGQDAQISFELNTGEMYRVDISEEGDTIPKYIRAQKKDADFIREYLNSIPEERRLETCINNISEQINKNNRYATSEIKDYVRRIVNQMKDDELSAMETAMPAYIIKIKSKIKKIESEYQEKIFYKWLDSGKIMCKPMYEFPKVITPANVIDSIPLSLYDAEKDDMNEFERKVLDIIASQDNVLYWHRIIDRGEREFRINGFINHYPDFFVKTKNGKVVLVETKGDYLDGSDSERKLKLGRKWQSLAGAAYRYFMVFESKEIEGDGAYTLDDFVEVFKNL